MPEYRRFVAYFYEYIDGKKQKNTGFVKVELRNGTWRILFRLTAPVHPRPPVEVFGFVREGDWLLSLPMGTMRAGREMMEEWAYHNEPMWMGKYGVSDFSGIWIRSGDGRAFLTVWDEEPVDITRFVMKLPKEQENRKEQQKELLEQEEDFAEEEKERSLEADAKQSGPIEESDSDAGTVLEQNIEAAREDEQSSEVETVLNQNVKSGQVEGQSSEVETVLEQKSAQTEEYSSDFAPVLEQNARHAQMEKYSSDLEQNTEENRSEESGQSEEKCEDTKIISAQKEYKQEENTDIADETIKGMEVSYENIFEKEIPSAKQANVAESVQEKASLAQENEKLWKDIYSKNSAFQPFSDQEISDCIRVAPGDILQLQRAHWHTGRNSFLMHGYHNYRHLLIGKTEDGNYVLGVPGIMNPQEKYLAVMFGFPNFKFSDEPEQNPAGGYWYRILEQGQPENI